MPRIVFDPREPELEQSSFSSATADWSNFYGDVKEDLLAGMPDSLGKRVHTTCFVDANHDRNAVTRLSHT